MLTEDGPKVLEYNARFGDPEAQVVLPRMKNDIIDVMEACVDGRLDTIDLQFEDNAAVCVVLASDGYPVSYEKGFKISGFEKFDGKDDYFCFHAGTKFDDNGDIVTNGGRVLGITATGADLKEARKKPTRQPSGLTLLINICVMILEKQSMRQNKSGIFYLFFYLTTGTSDLKSDVPCYFCFMIIKCLENMYFMILG